MAYIILSCLEMAPERPDFFFHWESTDLASLAHVAQVPTTLSATHHIYLPTSPVAITSLLLWTGVSVPDAISCEERLVGSCRGEHPQTLLLLYRVPEIWWLGKVQALSLLTPAGVWGGEGVVLLSRVCRLRALGELLSWTTGIESKLAPFPTASPHLLTLVPLHCPRLSTVNADIALPWKERSHRVWEPPLPKLHGYVG